MTESFSGINQPFAPLTGIARLMRQVFLGEDLAPLGQALLNRALANPEDANAYLDCSHVLQLLGHRELAMAMQRQAIDMQPHYSIPASLPAKLRLLVIMGPGDLMSNTPIEFLLENSDVALDFLYLTEDSPWPDTLPEHDVLMVATAESEENQPLLQRISELTAHWPKPVVNRAEHIAVLSRDGVCAALQNLPKINMPVTVRIDRDTLQALADGTIAVEALLPGDQFPLIVRPVGSHAGKHLEKMLQPGDILDYLDEVDAERFYLSRFVDYSGKDGLFRKYRIALIEGKPFVCHFAVSSHWMIHYLNAGMGESAEKRAEEAECMAHFDREFAIRHAAALAAIDQKMGLPYLGIDCAETAAGDLLIFEADNAMIVHSMDPIDLYPYKQPAMQKVFSAFRQLLEHARTQ